MPFLLAQAPADPPIVAGGQLESVWDFVVKGGPAMIAIILVSLVAMAVLIERLLILRKGALIPAAFVEGLKGIWADRDRALAQCRQNNSPAARILEAALSRRPDGVEAVERSVADAGRREIIRLRHRMRLFGSLPQVSTMLGLLGTIFGMIKTFQAVAASGQALGKTELLAKGIFEAWTCTAAGLLVAIPVMVAYHMLLGRIDNRIVQLDNVAEDFLNRERELARAQRHQPAVAAPAPAPIRTAQPIPADPVAVPVGVQ
jgi:biopolymer transport protein ExbB